MQKMKGATSIRFDAIRNSRDNELVEGRDFCFDAFRFERHLIAKIEPLALDLLRVAVGVYVADRKFRRNTRSTWSTTPRDMTIDIQVSRPEFWGDPAIGSLIEDVLRFLSSDLWRLSFSRLPHDPVPQQGAIKYKEQRPIVCLYSGGLDSAAGLATWLKDCAEPVLATTVLHQLKLKRLCGEHIRLLRDHYQRNLDLVPVHVQLIGAGRLDSQEQTQRSRAFLFIAAGIATAIVKQASRILMFESGVGAINAPLMTGMATGSRTTRSSHPYLLRRMSELATLVAQRPIAIELPFWQHTKAELVSALAERATSNGKYSLVTVAKTSISCVHHRHRTNHRQCGVCLACIGRRQAMLYAGIAEENQEYEWDLFSQDGTRAPPPDQLESIKAIIAQVHDFAAIGPELDLPDRLRGWVMGTEIATSEEGARPWLAVLRKYRSEWLTLADTYRDSAVPWAEWLVHSAHEGERHVCDS